MSIAMTRVPGLARLASPIFVLCAAQFMIQLDFTIVNVTLKPIQSDLGFSATGLQWVVTGYALTFGSLLMLGGRLGDRVGRRRQLVFGLALFGVASAACALAQSPATLVGARVVQGVGAALLAPMILAILTSVYTDAAAQARAIGIWTAATAGGAMSGVVVGGLLSDWLGWRSIFVVNVPIVAALIPLARAVLPEVHAERARSLDAPGAISLTFALATLIFGMSSGEQRGFGAAVTVVALVVSAALFVAFVLIERSVREPAVSFPFLAATVRRTAVIVLLVVAAVLGGYVYFVALYIRGVLELSGSTTAVAMIPGPVGTVLFSLLLTRHLIVRFGMKPILLIGLLGIGGGQIWLAQLTGSSSYFGGVLPALVLTGASAGLVFPAVAAAVAAGATAAERGLVGGIVPTAQQVGGAVGVAVLATIAAAVTESHGGDLASGYARAFAVGTFLIAAVMLLVACTPFRTRSPA